MQSISLADELTLEPAPAGRVGDEVLCPGVTRPPEANLAARALREFRARTGWQAPPLRLTIDKRIPVAAGLAGGSADAAATLRLARAASGLGDDALLLDDRAELGADVPGAGRSRPLAGRRGGRAPDAAAAANLAFGVLVLPAAFELSTAEVYAEADRLGLARDRAGARAAATRSSPPLSPAARRCPPPRSCSTTICSARRSRCVREIAEALRASARRRLAGAAERLGSDRDRAVRTAPRGGARAGASGRGEGAPASASARSGESPSASRSRRGGPALRALAGGGRLRLASQFAAETNEQITDKRARRGRQRGHRTRRVRRPDPAARLDRVLAAVGTGGRSRPVPRTCSRVFVGAGVAGALAVVYFWG